MSNIAAYPHQKESTTGLSSLLTTPGVAFALVFLAATIPFIGVHDLFGSSEAREAQVSRLIVETGQFVLPERAGVIASKPPLMHWIAASVISVTKWNALYSMRFLSALFAAGILALTVFIAERHASLYLYYERSRSRSIGISAGVVLSTSYLFLRLARDARVDMGFAFFCMLAFATFFHHIVKGDLNSKSRLPLLFFVALGLATLTKGPVGIVLPSLCCFAVACKVLGVKNAAITLWRSLPGWLLCGGIIMLWYVPAALEGGKPFIERLLFENLYRFGGLGHLATEVPAQKIQSSQPWYYLTSFAVRAAPWSFLFFALVARSFYRSVRQLDRGFNQARSHIGSELYLIYFLSGLLFFSLSAGRRHSYLLPLLPAAAIYLALKMHDLFCRQADLTRSYIRKFFNSTLYGVGIIAFLSLVMWHSLPFLHQTGLFLQSVSLQGTLYWFHSNQFRYSVVFLLIVAGVFYVHRWSDRHAPSVVSWLFHCYLLITLALALFSVGHGVKAHLKGFRRISSDIDRQVLPHSQIAIVRENNDEYFDPIVYYLTHSAKFTTLEDLPTVKADFFLMRARLLEQVERIEGLCPRGEVAALQHYAQSSDIDRNRFDRHLVLAGCFEALGF